MIIYYIYIFLCPFFYLIYIYSLFNSKVRHNLFSYYKILQQVSAKLEKNNKKVILFHAASAGEFEQLKPLLKRINRKKYFIVQSFTSSTIFNSLIYQDYVDIACYQPYDFLFNASKYFFKTIKPDYYIITRHDVWPNHIVEAKKLSMKIFYINANLHKNSIWNYSFMKGCSTFILNKFDLIMVPSNRIKNNIINYVDSSKIKIVADTRFQQIYDRYINNKDNQILPEQLLKSNNIIFGSIDENDENIILDALKKRYPNGDADLIIKNEFLIIVPHEIDNKTINRLAKILDKLKFKFNLYTDEKTSNILIVNHVGILADLYKYAKLAYIGGGFSRGVHSVIEPAIYNCLISFGPNIEMLDEAQELYNAKIGFLINESNDLVKFLSRIDKDNAHLGANKFILNNINSMEEILQYIQ